MPDLYPMSDEERAAAKALALCNMPGRDWEQKFTRDVAKRARAEGGVLTQVQRQWLWRLVHKYRRQVPDEHLRGLAAAAVEQLKAEV